MSIKFDNVSFTYSPNTPFSYDALKDVNFEFKGHFFTALIGQTGSGKSTLTQLMNGLLMPSKGKIVTNKYEFYYNEKHKEVFKDLSLNPGDKKYKKRIQFPVKNLRKEAGLVFQFPEYQLFEKNVLLDVCYGPKNFGASDEDAKKVAKEALRLVGLDESYYERSPFDLSGGEKRRVAIAGILALEPEILILDEPTAGLDPEGEKMMMSLFNSIYESGKSIIIVTHNMDLVLKYVNSCVVMNDGQVISVSSPLELFQNDEILSKTAIEPPEVFKLALKLREKGMNIDLKKIKDIKSLALEIKRVKDEY